ncbi:MAG: hypothetical protein FJ028_06980, partial [Chloroflexi bacterium]|nr:hypothetical protein [Chloroflexota bacterium]
AAQGHGHPAAQGHGHPAAQGHGHPAAQGDRDAGAHGDARADRQALAQHRLDEADYLRAVVLRVAQRRAHVPAPRRDPEAAARMGARVAERARA